MPTYIHARLGKEVGEWMGIEGFAEGWRKRLHLGYGEEDYAPLEAALGEYLFKKS